MKPKKQEMSACDGLVPHAIGTDTGSTPCFVPAAGKIDWSLVEEQLGRLYAEVGRPGIPSGSWLVHYLKHAFNESDETAVACWVENPYWQYFGGEEYFRHALPIDPSQMTRFRVRVGEGTENSCLALRFRLDLQPEPYPVLRWCW